MKIIRRKDKSQRTRIVSLSFRPETEEKLDRFQLWWDADSRSATVSKILADFVLNSRYHDDFFQYIEANGLLASVHEKKITSRNKAFSIPNWVVYDLNELTKSFNLNVSNFSVLVRSIIEYLYARYFCQLDPEIVNDIMKRLSGAYVVQGIFMHPDQGLISIRVIRSRVEIKKPEDTVKVLI